jgi:recombination protein RecR
MDKISALTEQFTKFPGVGPRQARRIVYHLLRSRKDALLALANDIASLKDSVSQCTGCFRHFTRSPGAQSEECSICQSTSRTHTLMIVEKDVDLENIERSGTYTGQYFVLGGLYAPLAKEPLAYVRLGELLSRVAALRSAHDLTEIVIALAINPDGDETARMLEGKLATLNESTDEAVPPPFSITHLGRGLSTGSELEYADPETIKHALRSRF